MSCPICDSALHVSSLKCESCNVKLEGDFALPRIARLEKEDLLLAEKLILSGGNLKELAVELEMSYPTLRKRLDRLIDSLVELKRTDKKQTQIWLDAVEDGAMSAEEASRRIGELTSGR